MIDGGQLDHYRLQVRITDDSLGRKRRFDRSVEVRQTSS